VGWVVTPPTPVAAEPVPGWDDTPTLVIPEPVRGWLAFAGAVTMVGDLTGDGNLGARFIKRSDRLTDFLGSGALAAQLLQRIFLSGDFEGDGALSVHLDSLLQHMDGGFGAEGELDISLQILVGEVFLPRFNGMGHLGTVVTVVPPAWDGLRATVLPRFATTALFSGSGILTGGVFEIEGNLANFAGSGALAATFISSDATQASFSGVGTLVTTAYQYKTSLLSLSGIGTFSGTVLPKPAITATLSGAGALTATDLPVYAPVTALSGSGALTATVSQRYIITTESVLDDFNRPDSALSAGPQWVNRNGALGVSNNMMYPVNTAFWQVASHTAVMKNNDMEVSIVLGPHSGGGDYTTILLGCNEAGHGVFVFFNGGAGVTIYTQDDWALTNLVVQTSLGATQGTGDRWTARRSGNVYSVHRNDSPIGLTWTDSADIIPRDTAHRQVGAAQYNDGGGYRGINDFHATDAARLAGNGTLVATAVAVPRAVRTAAFSGSGTLAASANFPVVAEVTTQLTTVGAYSYTIPWWANFVDEIFLGAGGGGAGGSGATAATGNGALAGTYSNRTLVRGSNLPWATAQLTGNIGDGGNPGSQNNAGVGGSPVTRNAISGGDIARQGNGGGGGAGTGGDPGRAAGNLDFNGKTYVGGAQANSGGNPGAPGNPPGGGGAGGQGGIFNTGKAGGKGGRGQAWFRAYQ
jgi:hypothetical protein